MQRAVESVGATSAAVEAVRDASARLRDILVASTMAPAGGIVWLAHDVELAGLVAQVMAIETLAAGAAGETAMAEALTTAGS